MRWEGERQSDNVEDRRGGGGRGGPVMISGGLGTLVLVVIMLLMGADPRALLQNLPPPNAPAPGNMAPEDNGPVEESDEEAKLRQFVATILASTEDVWTALLQRAGKRYEQPKLVLFRGQVRSACGLADAAVGPFYCPGDSKVYLDFAFFDELSQRFQAPGDFAQAYVVAHEVGHHIQNILGISDQVDAARRRAGEVEGNRLSVRLELQADFFAGVWAHHAQKQHRWLEEGDIEEGLRAATAIGDDRLQKQARGRVVPDSFTHGTSEQRLRWFSKGLKTGDINQGNTFDIKYNEL